MRASLTIPIIAFSVLLLVPVGSQMAFAGTCSSDSDCKDSNDCTADRCAAGFCTNLPVLSGTNCDNKDGNSCTGTCNGIGSCTSGSRILGTSCDNGDSNVCSGICRDGTCTDEPKLGDIACNDGRVCTDVDRCLSGFCTGAATPKVPGPGHETDFDPCGSDSLTQCTNPDFCFSGFCLANDVPSRCGGSRK